MTRRNYIDAALNTLGALIVTATGVLVGTLWLALLILIARAAKHKLGL